MSKWSKETKASRKQVQKVIDTMEKPRFDWYEDMQLKRQIREKQLEANMDIPDWSDGRRDVPYGKDFFDFGDWLFRNMRTIGIFFLVILISLMALLRNNGVA